MKIFKKNILKNHSSAFILFILLVVCNTASAVIFQPDFATASSEFSSSYVIENAINGSGLPLNFGPTDSHADYGTNNHWTTAANQVPGNSVATFTFENDVTIGTMYLWNHRSNIIASNSEYAVTQFDLILYDANNRVLLTLTDLKVVGNISIAQLYPFTPVNQIRKIDFIIKSNERFEAGNISPNYTGIAEIAFDSESLSQATPTTLASGSFAEPSDVPEQAVPILVNDEPQYHLLDDKGDQDWFEFYAEKGTPYTIKLPQTSIGSAIDPIVTLFDKAGNELESVNNSPLGQEEQLNWTATDTALFRIRVTNGTVIKTKEKPTALEYAYTINVFLSDAPQQGIIKGSVLDSCQQLGLGKVVVTAALGGQFTESTFTHKTGEYGIPINPGDYDLNTQIENYQNSQKNISVEQVTASQVQFSLDPVTDCSQIPVRVADPTILLQQAVANYNDQTGILIIKDVLADGRTYYAELQDQGGYNFSLTDAIELPGSVHSGPADYSFETLLVNIPEVFAFNTLYKVQMKNDGDFLFSLVDASTP